MGKSSYSSSSGAGWIEILLIVFVVLKLMHLIDWSWWWVLSPLWIGALVIVLLAVFVGIFSD